MTDFIEKCLNAPDILNEELSQDYRFAYWNLEVIKSGMIMFVVHRKPKYFPVTIFQSRVNGNEILKQNLVQPILIPP